MSHVGIPVLFVSHHADIVGGGEISLLSLIKGLDRSRWAPCLVVSDEGAVACASRALGVPTYRVPMPSCRWPTGATMDSMGHLGQVIRETGAQLVHANGSRAMMYAGLAGRRAGKRVVWHVREPESDGIVDCMLAMLAHRIIVISQAVSRRFPFVSAQRMCCIYNGIDLNEFAGINPHDSQDLRRKFWIPSDSPLVVSIGQLVPRKGYATMIDAAKQLAEQLPTIHWLIVGEGEERAELEARVANQGLSSVFHFSGWLAQPQVALDAADIFALTSVSEGFGRVLIEAMAMHKPVVATRIGGIPEVVVPGETGLLVPASDAGALSHAIRTLISDKSLADSFGHHGRSRVEQQFSLTQHVEAVSEVYDTLVA